MITAARAARQSRKEGSRRFRAERERSGEAHTRGIPDARRANIDPARGRLQEKAPFHPNEHACAIARSIAADNARTDACTPSCCSSAC